MFKIEKTHIEGVVIIEPNIIQDDRGFFYEAYNKKELDSLGLKYTFVQDNQSKSKKGVLRGLHFQKNHPQAKCARVLFGKVYDVAVDLRKGSNTYGEYVGVVLSSKNKKMIIIPRGFAHGMLVLSETAIFEYKCDDYYYPDDEGGIAWDDPTINIKWPIDDVILSNKDKNRPKLKDCIVEFKL